MSYRSLLLTAALCVAIGSAAQAQGLGGVLPAYFHGYNFAYWYAHYPNGTALVGTTGSSHPADIHKLGNGVTPPRAAFNAGRGARMGR